MVSSISRDPSSISVMVLKGGDSDEREISLVSGAACAQALKDEGFQVSEIDTGKQDAFKKLIDARPDVVFIALHGRDGEDGTVQGMCQLLKLPYTGPGVLASALAMDKTRAKIFYRAAGLPTPPSLTIEEGEDYDLNRIVEEVGEICVVKPTGAGSAIGVTICSSADEIPQAIETARAEGGAVLVEKCIKGTEITVAVLGNTDPEALPVIEIVPQESSDFYDFEAKYAPGGATHICPARLSAELTRIAQDQAIKAHKVLGCRGVSRTDMIVDEEGIAWLLETNTIPGMTSTSLLPDAAKKVGIEFGPLCRKLVELALE